MGQSPVTVGAAEVGGFLEMLEGFRMLFVGHGEYGIGEESLGFREFVEFRNGCPFGFQLVPVLFGLGGMPEGGEKRKMGM